MSEPTLTKPCQGTNKSLGKTREHSGQGSLKHGIIKPGQDALDHFVWNFVVSRRKLLIVGRDLVREDDLQKDPAVIGLYYLWSYTYLQDLFKDFI